MKTFLIFCMFMIFSAGAHAAGWEVVYGGECGPYKPSFRVRGASAVNFDSAHSDANAAVKIACRESCHGDFSGNDPKSCGVSSTELKDGIFYVSSDYLCSCNF